MIKQCCICGRNTETIYSLPFKYSDDLFNDIYIEQIGICKHCGFIYTQNPFSISQLESRYKNYSKYEYNATLFSNSINDIYKKRCKRQKTFLNDILPDIKTIIEIGASSGYNLSLYKDKSVLGIEPSAYNCQTAKEMYNVNMFNGMFSEYIINKNDEFDLVFLSHTLEHIINPFEFIKQCSSICNKYIFIEVPTIDYKFIDEPFGFFCDEHVNYFTLEGLYNIMYKNNFELLKFDLSFNNEIKITSGNPSLVTIWEKKSKLNNKKHFMQSSENIINNYILENNKLITRINEKISKIETYKKLAIYGVGNHCSMLLANTDLKNKKITKFYDSDVRKHDFTIMGKRITRFNENDVINNDIECILIATYTAQEYIYNDLKQYEDKCEIIKLYDY